MPAHPVTIITPGQLNPPGEIGPFPIGDFERRCLAQGDSWFSIGAWPPFLTTNLLLELDGLERGTCIVNCASPGRTLRRMVDNIRSNVFRRLLADNFGWDAILVSGGGNDLIEALGSEDPDPRLRLLARRDEWDDPAAGASRYLSKPGWLTFSDHLRAVFEELALARDAGAAAGVPIVMHTYDIAVPRPSPAAPGFGPWFSKALARFGVPETDWIAVAVELFDVFRQLLRGIGGSLLSMILVDTAGTLARARVADRGVSGDWQNEIHPTRAGYQKLAGAWETVLNQQFG